MDLFRSTSLDLFIGPVQGPKTDLFRSTSLDLFRGPSPNLFRGPVQGSNIGPVVEPGPHYGLLLLTTGCKQDRVIVGLA